MLSWFTSSKSDIEDPSRIETSLKPVDRSLRMTPLYFLIHTIVPISEEQEMRFGSPTPTSQTSRSSEVSSTPPPQKTIWGFVSSLLTRDNVTPPETPVDSSTPPKPLSSAVNDRGDDQTPPIDPVTFTVPEANPNQAVESPETHDGVQFAPTVDPFPMRETVQPISENVGSDGVTPVSALLNTVEKEEADASEVLQFKVEDKGAPFVVAEAADYLPQEVEAEQIQEALTESATEAPVQESMTVESEQLAVIGTFSESLALFNETVRRALSPAPVEAFPETVDESPEEFEGANEQEQRFDALRTTSEEYEEMNTADSVNGDSTLSGTLFVAADLVSSTRSSDGPTRADSNTVLLEPLSGDSLTSVDFGSDMVSSTGAFPATSEVVGDMQEDGIGPMDETLPGETGQAVSENEEQSSENLEEAMELESPTRKSPRASSQFASAFSALTIGESVESSEGIESRADEIATPAQEEAIDELSERKGTEAVETMVHTDERSSPDNDSNEEAVQNAHCVLCGRRGLTVHSSKTRSVSV